MNKLLGIDSIMFVVKDLAASSKFYGDALGLKRVWADGERGMIGFVFGESKAEIVITDNASLPNADFSFLVEDVESFCENFRQQGHSVLFGPIEVRCGKYAVLSDLDSNRIPIIDLTKFGGQPKYDK